MAATGCTMASLTVLDEDNDPFRLDTPSRHRDGAWLAAAIAISAHRPASTSAACTMP